MFFGCLVAGRCFGDFEFTLFWTSDCQNLQKLGETLDNHGLSLFSADVRTVHIPLVRFQRLPDRFRGLRSDMLNPNAKPKIAILQDADCGRELPFKTVDVLSNAKC